MAQNNQDEFPINASLESQTDRKTARHLPSFFRTDSNKKFLGGTLDPLTQPGKLTRINSYVGRRDIPNYEFTDNYEEETNNARQYYQLEPSYVYDDPVAGTVNWYADYNDYMNSLKYFGAFVGNHGNLNKSEAYSWDPNIDWDKFVNFQQYYWLPNGPDPITIYGKEENITSTYTIESRLDGDNTVYIFSPDGLTANPTITLYRGQTYIFNITAKGAPFSINIRPEIGSMYFYSGFSNQLMEVKTNVTFTVPLDAPSVLYYINNNDINSSGIIEVKDIKEAAFLDVEKTILGKKNVTVMQTAKNPAGVELINGLKIKFGGDVVPKKYATGNWYVEGVGNKIKLINASDLASPATYGSVIENPFDNQPFDSSPFEIAEDYPKEKDYIVINRASRDRNIWSRNNRWFHINVIKTTASVNDQTAISEQIQRGIRPIIEFASDLKLFNNGWIAKKDIDLVDTKTTDVFSKIEGCVGYYIDEELIYPGQRILFLADPDPLVYGRIFQVTRIFNANENKTQISLQSIDDTDPIDGQVVYVTKGTVNKGSSYFYQNGKWALAQKKIKINQSPLFDLFDESYNSFSDITAYPYNNFSGNKVFSYLVGLTGKIDDQLGFPLSYNSINNVGDIEFSFDLQKGSWTYQSDNMLSTLNSYSGFLRKLNNDDTFSYTNGWVQTYKKLEQPVIRILKITSDTNLIPIDVYDSSATLSGLSVRVYVNDKKVDPGLIQLSFENIQGYFYIRFTSLDKNGNPLPDVNTLTVDDKVVYKVTSSYNKNARGYYEIPHNWQNNPLNETINSFTFGEVIDHVKSMVDNLSPFTGAFPGVSNLASLGSISHYGNRFLQHAGSMPLAAVVMTDKHANVVKALRYTAQKYTAFKKEFIRLATNTSVDGSAADIVDSILSEYTVSKFNLSPFYYSDMVAAGASLVRKYTVSDPRFPVFIIDSIFTPMTTSRRQILIYLNDTQLLYEIDYEFETLDAFVTIKAQLAVGDVILIKDYVSSDGRSYIPYTPSKLGLYPTYVPRKYLDDTYSTPTEVIQGHDGSIVVAYNDYRDDLILELEKRIFNSRKVEYDPSIFNIDDIVGGYYRTTDFSQAEVNKLLIADFLRWNTIADLDLTSNDYYVEEETFTYNYNSSLDLAGKETLFGYWRGVYKHFYDTDRPHTCPWEMQGLTIKPVWWDNIYGEAPYTSENKIMWDNIEKGLIPDPKFPRVNLRYARPGLSAHLPVDSDGNLVSPLNSNLAKNFSLVNAKNEYSFGDQAPVETIWRRSSELPYSIMIAMCVLRGSEFIAKMWDRFRVKRNIAGQIYYTETGLKIQPSNLVFPNVSANENDLTAPVSVTSGLVNFIEEYLYDLKYINTGIYKKILQNLDAKLSYRIGGYTSKDQINVLLDSRSPNATGTVFLPKENFKVFYNKSSPVDTISYSGVIIEKIGSSYPQWVSGYRYHLDDWVVFQGEIYHCTMTHVSDTTKTFTAVEQFNQNLQKWNKVSIPKIGYKVRGYDSEKNYFEVFGYRSSQNDSTINVGGISESYVSWTGNLDSTIDADPRIKELGIKDSAISSTLAKQVYYAKGQIVRVNDTQYYRAIIGHTASSSFEKDSSKWAPLSKLPLTGGVSAIRRSRFGTTPIKIIYGTIFSTIQEVVDFLLGYQKRLELWGFNFNDYNKELDVPLTWLTSAKEFMFWTLQNWAPGAVITLSPSANKISFVPAITASIDTTDTDFYDYSIFKADGSPLRADLTDVYRENSGFVIKPGTNTNDGIFHIRANLVYKEHVLLFDNVSIFNDTIYDKVPGYRQGRLKILGYKTMAWDGGYTSPGFMYDEAIVNDWEPNTDYPIGSVVKYKNYYFTATEKILSKFDFSYTDPWKQLSSAPTPGLIPNFDYKIEQFRDFYSLDASNFNSTQETLARHLIGYQPRQYLANIINDDVSQYKFYQGFIKEKGSRNSIDKLFDALRASGFSTVSIKEEWAFKIGEYGSIDAYTELEFPLNEQKFLYNPQNINLSQSDQSFSDLSIYNITNNDISIKPSNYNSNPFKTTKIDPTQYNYGIFKYQVAGYVREEDVDHIVINESALLNYDITLFKEKDKIWLGYTSNNDWNVYEYLNTNIIITGWSASDNIISLVCNVIPDVNADDIIVISNLDAIDGSYKIQNVYNNIIEIYTFNSTIFTIQDNTTSGIVHTLKSARYASLSAVSANRYNTKDIRNERIWIDSDATDSWVVLKNQDSFTESERSLPFFVKSNQKYGHDVKISANDKWMFVSSVGAASGTVTVYNRSSGLDSWQFLQTLTLPEAYINSVSYSEKFGTSVDTTEDGSIVVIGATDVSGLKTSPLVNGLYFGKENGTNSGLTNQGIVVVYVYNKNIRRYEFDIIIASRNPQSNEKFGSKVKLAQTGDRTWLFVSSKNYYNDRGRVQYFSRESYGWWGPSTQYISPTNINITDNNMYGYDIDCTSDAGLLAISAPYKDSGAVYIFELNKFDSYGNDKAPEFWDFKHTATIDATSMNTGEILNTVQGNVYLNNQDLFGYSIAINDTSLFVSSPNSDTKGFDVGSIYIFDRINHSYSLSQYLLPPIVSTNERFGTKISVSKSKKVLAVSAMGGSSIIPLTFDNYSNRVSPISKTFTITGTIFTTDNVSKITGITDTTDLFTGMSLIKTSSSSDPGKFGGIARITSIDSPTQITITSETNNSKGILTFRAEGLYYSYELDSTSLKLDTDGTTFDNNSLLFYDNNPYTGAVYVYNKFDDHYIYADRLRPVHDLDEDDNFGSALSVTNSTIAVGTPNRQVKNTENEINRYGTVFIFDYTELSWSVEQSQDSLVDISKFKKAFIFNSEKNILIQSLDFYDPAKGRIPSIADQELKYQTYYDPAVYQYGVPSEVAVDESIPWTDEHVGELWWDLSTVKFTWYEQGDSTFRNNNWGRIFTGCSIDIYEWVETTYLPSKWAEIADTEAGIALGISGIPKDIDNFTWSSKYKYDPISGTNTTIYYYWVKYKITVPNIPSRKLSCADVTNLILDPKSQGYEFVSITDKNSLSLTNIGSKLIDSDISLNLQFYEVDNTDLLTHREYVLIATDDQNAVIPKIIENKWFDSLIGSNTKGQTLPDFKLSAKQRYGNLNKPRQSWFINRFEALKQFFEYINSVLAKNIIVDEINFSNLEKNDPAPTLVSGEIDKVIDVLYELKFVGTSQLQTAKISVQQIIEGEIWNILIDEMGYGYGRNKVYSHDTEGNPLSWYGPTVDVTGFGSGAIIQTEIDKDGRVIHAYIIKRGHDYDDNTSIIVRDYRVLVRTDEESNNSWSVQTWDNENQEWNRSKTQSFNVKRYWSYKDWYDVGFGLISDISFQVNRTVDLNGLPARIGDIVKITNAGYGDWLLLQRKEEKNTSDFTDDYIVIGRQNGTIQFSDNLYNLNKDSGFDTNFSFDLTFYDQSSSVELRIILETLRDYILVGPILRSEYINLFFNSVYYVLSEQLYTDWCFKTSFLKVNHNVGTLKERPTFKSDEVASYQDFLEEAKPYKTKIREWVSSYQKLEESKMVITDFDLQSYYNSGNNSIERTTSTSSNVTEYPWKNWLDHNTYQIKDIILIDGGTNYTTNPVVIITGNGSGAEASAYVSNGKVYKIVVTKHGTGYTTIPTVVLSGGNGDIRVTGGIRAKAYAILGSGLVRTNRIGIKFDRYSFQYSDTNFKHTEYFNGTGNRQSFNLTFAPELEKNKFTIFVDNIEYYGSQYDVSVIDVVHDSYTALEGYVIFKQAPITGIKNVEITYYKNIELYSAADRINYAYNPTAGQYGKDLGQLMTGVDYSGVTVTSIDFDVGGGWDVLPWDVSSWDNNVSSNDDYVVLSDGVTRSFTLPYVPALNEIINIYLETKFIFSSTIAGSGSLTNPSIIPVYESYGVRLGDSVKILTLNFVNAGKFAPRQQYTIDQPGNTDFTLFGALNNNAGTVFTATNIGSGTGIASFTTFRYAKVIAIDNDIIVLDRVILGTILHNEPIEFSRNMSTRVDDNLIQDSFVGDGIHKIVNIDNRVILESGNLITFRKSTSDGALLPLDRSLLDTLLSGGDINVSPATGNFSSATGFNPEDIVVDGDGFVTSNSSHGPEELVQGNVFDTLDMKVYHTPSSGGPNVYVNNYIGNGTTQTYKLTHIPGSENGVIVLVGNTPVTYSVDYLNKNITLTSAPALESYISIITFDTGGYDILDKAVVIGDGTIKEFLTAADYSKDNITVFVIVNGVEVGASVIESNSKYTSKGKVVVQLTAIPAINSVIQIMVYSGNIQKYSKVTTEHIPIIPNKLKYSLSVIPGVNQPFSANVFVEIDGYYLAAPDYQNFVYDGSNYQIMDPRYPSNSLVQSDINLYINGRNLHPNDDFIFDSDQNLIRIGNQVASKGDNVIVEIVKRNDFQIIDNEIIFTGTFDLVKHDTIKVTTFTNHNVENIKRLNKGFRFSIGYDLLGYDSYRYSVSSTSINSNGIFDLPRTVSNTSGIFVLLTRKILAPNVDFVLLDNMRQIKVSLPDDLIGNDYIEIITTTDQTVHPTFGYKIFKDMTNRSFYKVLDNTRITTLAQDLKITDTSIVVTDGSVLTKVNNSQHTDNKVYGIIEINGEMIEYFMKTGNTLSQLRRGISGTSTSELIPAGTKVVDNGPKLTIPYSDYEVKRTAYGDGTNKIFDFDFVPEVTTSPKFYTDTLDINGTWYRETVISTVTSSGYFIPGKIYIIQVIGTTDFISIGASSNKIGLKFKATGVGNPSTTGKAALVEYPSIPVNFGQCDEIEVYVAGRRLTKIPTLVYDTNTGQDSYKNAGDVQREAEFSVDGISKLVRLTKAPNAGELVLILSKQGTKWQDVNESLPFVYSSSNIAKFVTTKYVDLPK